MEGKEGKDEVSTVGDASSNGYVSPLMTDFYQISMGYAAWGDSSEHAEMKIIRAALQPTLHDLSLCRRPCLPLPPPNRPPRALSSVELKTPRPSPGPHIPSSPASRASPPLHPSTP